MTEKDAAFMRREIERIVLQAINLDELTHADLALLIAEEAKYKWLSVGIRDHRNRVLKRKTQQQIPKRTM